MSEHPPARRAIVTGANGLVGRYLLPLLLGRGFEVQAVSRRAPGGGSPIWREIDLGQPTRPPGRSQQEGRRIAAEGREEGAALSRADVVFHTAPLWLLAPWLATFAGLGVHRLVAFSSTSRLTKESSGHPKERDTASRLAEAESEVAHICEREKIRWTVFRPTLIHGGGHDRNVTDIARMIRWLGFFPVAGEGRGRRQPVHAEDLAQACLAVLDKPSTFAQVYELPGGETLTYCELVSRIAQGLGRRPRLVHVPQPMLRAALSVLGRLPGFAHVTPDVAARMDQDLAFDGARAKQDFGYDPRPFRFPDEPR